MSPPDLIGFLKSAYPNGAWPRPFHVLEGLQRIAAGESPKDAAKAVGTSLHFLEKAQKSARPEFDILGLQPSDLTDGDLKKAGAILGQLLIGRSGSSPADGRLGMLHFYYSLGYQGSGTRCVLISDSC